MDKETSNPEFSLGRKMNDHKAYLANRIGLICPRGFPQPTQKADIPVLTKTL